VAACKKCLPQHPDKDEKAGDSDFEWITGSGFSPFVDYCDILRKDAGSPGSTTNKTPPTHPSNTRNPPDGSNTASATKSIPLEKHGAASALKSSDLTAVIVAALVVFLV